MIKKLYTTWFIIIVAMLFSFLSTGIPFIKQQVMLFAIILLAIFVIASKLSHAREHFWISAILFLVFLASYLIFIQFNPQYNPSKLSQSLLALRTASITAFLFLSFTFLIGPISRIVKKFSFYKYRRAFGIATFLLAGFHFFNTLSLYYARNIGNAFASQYALFVLFGFTAWIVLLFMALTSWDAVQKHLKSKNLKILHVLFFLTYILYLTWFYLLNKSFFGKGWIFALFVLFWVASAPWSSLITRNQERVDSWRQIHFLIWIAYASIVIHISLQLIEFQKFYSMTPIIIIFVSIVVLVLFTHGIGLILRIKEEVQLRKRYHSLGPLIHEKNETYYPAIRSSEFNGNEGKKAYIVPLKKYLAIHKVENRFYAFSAYCAHQKGPIDKAKIVGSNIICPWHGWAYDIKDGCSPKFGDAIPAYTSLVKSDIVYIKEKPIKEIDKI